MTPRSLAILPLCLLLSACFDPEVETVTSSWPESGARREVRIDLGEGKGEEVKQFHENGRIHVRGVMLDGQREGTWNTFREDGLPWSQVTYSRGVKEGAFRTWHTDGTPHIEGQHLAGQPSGTWKFYGTDGQLVEVTDFPRPN